MSPEAPGGSTGSAEARVRELEACVRDLVSLHALPALWTARDPRSVLELLFQALESILHVPFCYAKTTWGADDAIELLRVGFKPADDRRAGWSGVLTEAAAAAANVVEIAASPIGPLRIARLPIGYYGEGGLVLIGSSEPTFPTPTHSIFLRAATSLGMTGLHTARVMREREEAVRAKDEFLAMLGHELRNPLAPIVTALHLMRLKAHGAIPREQEIIERQIAHLRRLVDNLLDVSRVARGKIELTKEPLEVVDLVLKAVETAGPMLEQRSHQLQVDVPESGLRISGDSTRLTQVIANLLTNAAKYTEPGGAIDVSARREGSQIAIAVRDNGQGISPELLPHVFDMFVQGRRSVSRIEGGLGIGLTLVRTFVELHGGTVSARSAGRGKGSEFVVRLPAFTGPAEARPAAAPSRPGRATVLPRRVLVIDDNEDAAELLVRALGEAGHRVSAVHDGLAGLSAAASLAPDVVILDLGLPILDGYEVAARLRLQLGTRMPRLIAVTGYGQEHDRERSLRAGFSSHLVKPVDVPTLLAAIAAEAPPREPETRSRGSRLPRTT